MLARQKGAKELAHGERVLGTVMMHPIGSQRISLPRHSRFLFVCRCIQFHLSQAY